MSTISAPYGLKPIKLIGSQPFAAATREIAMTTNSASAIYTGSAVTLNSGQPAIITGTPTTTRGTTTPVGVCVGVSYTDPTLKYEMFAQYLPANAVNLGYTNIKIKIVDDPDCLFMIQADGAVAATARGLNAALANVGAGSTTYGTSTMQLSASSAAATATLAVRIVDFWTAPGSTVGDAYTDVIVKWNSGVHAYQNATGG